MPEQQNSILDSLKKLFQPVQTAAQQAVKNFSQSVAAAKQPEQTVKLPSARQKLLTQEEPEKTW